MRTLAFALIAAAAAQPPVATPPPAPATPQDYVCAFAGDCSDQADDQTQPGDLPGHPGISATRGFALSRPTPEGSARPSRAARRGWRGRRSTARRRRRRGSGSICGSPSTPGSARLTPDAMAQAGVFARALMLPQLVTMHFRIEGHTDSVGGRAMNLDLSQRRAQAVADFLVGMGVARDRLEVRGYGFDQPLPGTSAADGQNPPGRGGAHLLGEDRDSPRKSPSDQIGQRQRLAGIEPGIALALVAVGGRRRVAVAAFGDVGAGHFDMHAAGALAHDREKGLELGADRGDRPGLAGAGLERVAVHWVRGPEHRPARCFDRLEQWRQQRADAVRAHPHDQRDPPRLADRIDPVEQPQQRVGGEAGGRI